MTCSQPEFLNIRNTTYLETELTARPNTCVAVVVAAKARRQARVGRGDMVALVGGGKGPEVM